MTADGRHYEEQDASRAPPEVPVELLDHAVRCWEAELENARRQAIRTNLLLTVILTVLGLGAFSLGQVDGDTAPVWLHGSVCVVRVILLGSLMLFVRALWILLMIRYPARPVSWPGSRLRLPERLESWPREVDPQEARHEAFRCTYAAYVDLRRFNAAEQARIDRGQQALLLAVLHALAALACYTLLEAALPGRI